MGKPEVFVMPDRPYVIPTGPMTLEAIRFAKEKAEQEIRVALLAFQRATGMAPIGLRLECCDATRFDSTRREYAVGSITIDLEPI